MRRLRAWLAIPPGHALSSPWPLLVAVVIGASAAIAADHGIAALSLRLAEFPATSAAVLAIAQALGTNGLTALLSLSGKVVAIGLLIAVVRWRGWRLAEAFQARMPASDVRTTVQVAATLFGVWLVLILVRVVLVQLGAEGGDDEAQKSVALASVTIFLDTVIVTPLIEELLYRGMVFPVLLRMGTSFFVASLASSALWAMQHYHYSWPTQVELVFAGIAACWALARTQSLWPGLVAHFIWNACPLGLRALLNT